MPAWPRPGRAATAPILTWPSTSCTTCRRTSRRPASRTSGPRPPRCSGRCVTSPAGRPYRSGSWPARTTGSSPPLSSAGWPADGSASSRACCPGVAPSRSLRPTARPHPAPLAAYLLNMSPAGHSPAASPWPIDDHSVARPLPLSAHEDELAVMVTVQGEAQMPSTIDLSPSADTTGVTDAAAINAALVDVGAGGSVLLGPGDWYTSAPLAVPAGAELAGVKGAINGPTARAPAGSVIHPVAAFTGRGVISLSAVAGVRIRDLAIFNDLGTPANVDGIRCRGNVNGLEVLHVSVTQVSGYGLAYYKSGNRDGDGLWMSRCMFHQTAKS